MSKAYTLATLATSDLATQSDLAVYATSSELTTAVGNIIVDDNTPNFRVELRSDQSIPTAQFTPITFEVVLDTASGWDAVTYKYTIPETGTWFISSIARISGGGNNTVFAGDVNLYKNTDTNMLAHTGLTPNTSGAFGIYSASSAGIYSLTQDDEIYVQANVAAGSARKDGRSDGSFTARSGLKLSY